VIAKFPDCSRQRPAADGSAPKEVDYYRGVLTPSGKPSVKTVSFTGGNCRQRSGFASCTRCRASFTEYFRSKGDNVLEKYFWQNAHRLQW